MASKFIRMKDWMKRETRAKFHFYVCIKYLDRCKLSMK